MTFRNSATSLLCCLSCWFSCEVIAHCGVLCFTSLSYTLYYSFESFNAVLIGKALELNTESRAVWNQIIKSQKSTATVQCTILVQALYAHRGILIQSLYAYRGILVQSLLAQRGILIQSLCAHWGILVKSLYEHCGILEPLLYAKYCSTNYLLNRLENLAWTKKIFYHQSFYIIGRFLKPLLWWIFSHPIRSEKII